MIKNGDVHSHPIWRSEECAISSTRRIVRIAERYNKKAHVLHITTKQEIDFLSRSIHEADNQFNLVEIDHGLIVTPSESRKLVWVPIVTSLEMPGKKWQTELNLLEGGPHLELIQDY